MSSPEPAAELPLDTAGSRLLRAREGAGLSRADIASATRIPERYLAAIEGNRYEDLPARTYALGFIRSYARVVGLNGDEIAAELRAEIDGRPEDAPPVEAPAFTPGDPARAPSKRFAAMALAALVAVLVASFALWHSYFQPAGALPSLLPAPAPAASPSHAALPAGNVAAHAVVFTATADGIWVRFADAAGKQLLQRQMAKGESYAVPANAIGPRLWTSRPDALAITIDGKAQPPLATQQQMMKDVPVTATALLARASLASHTAEASVTATHAGDRAHPLQPRHHKPSDQPAADSADTAATPAPAAAVTNTPAAAPASVPEKAPEKASTASP